MPFIYYIMAEYTKQLSNTKEKERIEKQILQKTRAEYFMKKDIESIKTAIITAFYNNECVFECKRHCSEEYIEYIKNSLELFFLDSIIYYSYNESDNSYLLRVEWG